MSKLSLSDCMFTIVIPTHNGLDPLRDAVETVLLQDYADWELVIFDNGSSEDIGGYVNGLAHPKVRYVRSDEFLPVTDSWNRAIDLAQGHYVTMLGNDDGLSPGYFAKLDGIISSFNKPDLLYTGLYQFMYPGVFPGEPAGYVLELKNGFFFVEREVPFLLSNEDISKAVHGSIRLRRNFAYNMQAQCYRRELLHRLRADGPIFRSPFPDYYISNVVLARARSVVVVPEPLGIQGVCKSSFGYTLFNAMEEQGAAHLNTKMSSDPLHAEVERFLLPGPLYNTNFVLTMQHVVRYLHDYVHEGVDFDRYRRLQIYRLLCAQNGYIGRTENGRVLWSRLVLKEKVWTFIMAGLMRLNKSLRKNDQFFVRYFGSKLEPYAYQPPVKITDVGKYSRLIEYYRALEAEHNRFAKPVQPATVTQPGSGSSTSAGPITASNLSVQFRRIAVVYLARQAEDRASFQAFIESYERHPAGTEHDLVVIYKGYDKPEELKAAQAFFSIPHIPYVVSDEGFDITAYLKAAHDLKYDYFCFLNTHTRIAMSGWLAAMADAVALPGVGLVGTTASFESISDSWGLINKVNWLCNTISVSYDPAFAHYFGFIIKQHCQNWLESESPRSKLSFRSLFPTLKSFLRGPKRNWQNISPVDYQHIWDDLTRLGGPFFEHAQFPAFPNPHIRSNGFIVARQRLLTRKVKDVQTKIDACQFESGQGSLTRQVRREGLRVLVVNRFGKTYDIHDWAESGTFRIGNQDGLVLSDNQTRNFDSMSPGERATHERITWGDYLKSPPSDFPDLNFKFARLPGGELPVV